MTDTPKIAFDVEASLAGFAADLQKAEGMAREAGTKMAKALDGGMKLNGRSVVSQSVFRSAGFQEKNDIARYAAELEERIPTVFSGMGAKAGKSFGDGFASADAPSKIEKQLTSGIKKFLLIGAADAALRGLADAISTSKTWEDTGLAVADKLFGALKSVPIVGAFGEIGEAIGNAIGDAAAKAITGGEFGKGPGRGMPGGASLINQRPAMDAFDAANSRLSEAGMSPAALLAKRFNDEYESLQAAGEAARLQDLPQRMLEYRNAARPQIEAAFAADRERAKAKADAEIAKQDEAIWGEQDRKRKEARSSSDSSAMESRRERLGLLQDEMRSLSGVSASSFIETRDTAVGSFRFAQADASKQLADNSEELVRLGAQQVRLLDEIKRLQGVQFA